jgi:hypothetical protein
LLFVVSIFRKSRYFPECDLFMSERKPCRYVYILFVMLTIALRVNANKIPAVSFYLFKIDYFCHEIILNYLEALVKFLEICYIPFNCR